MNHPGVPQHRLDTEAFGGAELFDLFADPSGIPKKRRTVVDLGSGGPGSKVFHHKDGLFRSMFLKRKKHTATRMEELSFVYFFRMCGRCSC